MLTGAHEKATPDAIRGAAAAIVAVAHCWQIFLYPIAPASTVFAILGSLAAWSVATFFLLSGMLIALSIKRRSLADGFDFIDFMTVRILRIYPPLLACVLVCILAVTLIQGLGLHGSASYLWPGDTVAARDSASLTAREVATTLSLTYQLVPGHSYIFFDGPLWSLSLEFWMYVLAGLLAATFFNRSWLAAIAAIALLYQMLFRSAAAPLPFWVVIVVWSMGFLAGWLLDVVPKRLLRRLVVPAVGLAVLELVVAGGELKTYLGTVYSGSSWPFFYMLNCAIILCLILSLLSIVDTAWGFLTWIGSYSYTLYLLHFPIMLLMLSLLYEVFAGADMFGRAVLAIVSLASAFVLSWQIGRWAEDRQGIRNFVRATFARARARLGSKAASR